MNSALELDGKPLSLFCGVPMLNGTIVSTRHMIMICGWCDKDKSLTRQIKMNGYETSHGLCKACSKTEFGFEL